MIVFNRIAVSVAMTTMLVGCYRIAGTEKDASPSESDGGNDNPMGADSTSDTTPRFSERYDTTQCTPDRQPVRNEDWIADFESGTLQAGNSVHTYVGFFAFHDGTEIARMIPEPLEDGVGPATTDIEACTPSVMCVKNTVGQFTNWGAGVGMMIGLDDEGIPKTVDLTSYSGVFFWALRRPESVRAFRVHFPDLNTHPAGGVCDNARDVTQCFNDWHYQVVITEQNVWVPIEVRFDELDISHSWGLQPEAFRQDQVYGMQFVVPEATDFNFCIDDIYLF